VHWRSRRATCSLGAKPPSIRETFYRRATDSRPTKSSSKRRRGDVSDGVRRRGAMGCPAGHRPASRRRRPRREARVRKTPRDAGKDDWARGLFVTDVDDHGPRLRAGQTGQPGGCRPHADHPVRAQRSTRRRPDCGEARRGAVSSSTTSGTARSRSGRETSSRDRAAGSRQAHVDCVAKMNCLLNGFYTTSIDEASPGLAPGREGEPSPCGRRFDASFRSTRQRGSIASSSRGSRATPTSARPTLLAKRAIRRGGRVPDLDALGDPKLVRGPVPPRRTEAPPKAGHADAD